MSELKPCPFCGHEAKIVCVNTDRYDDWYVYCPSEDECPASVETLMFETKDEAIKAWNTRSERTCRNTQDDADFMCSVCGKSLDSYETDGKMNYCPNCGAKVVE